MLLWWRKRSIPLAMGMMLTIALIVLSWVMTQPTQAGQNGQNINDTEPFTSQVYNPCTGDLVTYAGTIHLVRTVTLDSAGGTHIQDHLDLHARGVDERGAKYAISQVDMANFISTDSSSVFTGLFLFNMQRQGETDTPDDFTSSAVIHITINANQITATSFEMRNEQCTPPSPSPSPSPSASASPGAAPAEATVSAQ